MRRPKCIAKKRKKVASISAVAAELLEDRTLLSTATPTTPDLLAAHDSGSSYSDNITKVNAPAIIGNAEAGSTVEIFDSGVPLGTTTTNVLGIYVYIPSPSLSDGTYQLTATANNGTGASDPSSALSMTIDTSAPAALDLDAGSDNGSSSTDDLTNDTTPTAEAGSTVALTSDIAGPVGSALTDGSGDWSIDSIALADGAHSLTATATDAAGNTSGASSALSVTIETMAPTVAVDTLTTNDTTPALSGTVDDNAAGISVTVDGQTNAATNNGDGTWTLADGTLTALAEGTYDVSVTATDVAGNAATDASSNELLIDTTLPVVTVDVLTTNDTTPALSGTVDDNAAGISVTVDGQTKPATNNGDGTWTLADGELTALAEGTFDVSVTATDVAGNAGTDASANELVIDTTAPVVTVDALTTNDTTPALSGTVDDNAAVISVTVDGQTNAATNNGDGTWTLADGTLTVLAEGPFDVSVTATDVAGNPGTDASSNELVIDTSAPAAPAALDLATLSDSGSSSTDDLTNVTTPTISGTAEIGSTVDVISDIDGSIGSAVTDGAGDWSIISTALADGAHSLTATATDAAGNPSVASSALTVTIDTSSPAAPAALDLAALSDSGDSDTDDLTNVTTPSISGVVVLPTCCEAEKVQTSSLATVETTRSSVDLVTMS
ncbi:MAG: Ig-like domain-containing protein [Planctomycetaceae bacterium]|nr:Ig-like domain-containing protein [Planctomycetaceae bacterium]